MGAVPFLEDQKSLVILVDNEHWCQLFYRSPPTPSLLLATAASRFRKHERPRVTRPVAFVKASPRACPARGIRRQLLRGCSGQGPQYQNQPYQRKPRRHLDHGQNYTGSYGSGQGSERRPRSGRSQVVPSTSPSTATRWLSIACRAAF